MAYKSQNYNQPNYSFPPPGWQSVGDPNDSYLNFGAPPPQRHDTFLPPPPMPVPPPGVMGEGVGGVGGVGPGGNAFQDAFVGASAGFLRSGIGAYGERLFGSSRDYVRSNMNKYFSSSDLQYYFQVSDLYVWNKVKIILCPFLHRGHWTRIAEQVAGGLTYKLPRNDINAPDLYIPLMAMVAYCIVGAFAIGQQGKFSPMVMNSRVSKAVLGWLVETILLRSVLYSLNSNSDTPILDLMAYGGYAFVGLSISISSWILFKAWGYYSALFWTSICMAVFLVRTMKRVLFAETRHYERDASKSRYLLLLIGASQIPIYLWLGRL